MGSHQSKLTSGAAPNISELEIQSAKRERTFIKLIVGGLVSVVLVIALGYLGLNFFHRWAGRPFGQTCGGLFERRTKAAGLSARRAIQINPTDADAARVLAEVADREGIGPRSTGGVK